MAHQNQNSSGSAGVSPAHGAPRGWYSRRYLPHCDTPGLIQAITFRLADALPKAVLQRLDTLDNDAERRRAIEAGMDAGHGACYLRDARCANIVEQSLFHGDGHRYRLLAWCIMPNHVHVLIEVMPEVSLATILQGWKSWTAKEINRVVGRQGVLWQREYFDRYIRDDRHLAAVIRYIHANPVKAGLVSTPEQWRYSSARFEQAGETPALPERPGRSTV